MPLNDPLLTWRDNRFYDEAGIILSFSASCRGDSQDNVNDSWLGTTYRAGYKFVSFAITCPFFSANADRELFSFSIVNLFLSPKEQANKQSGKCNFSPTPVCFL